MCFGCNVVNIGFVFLGHIMCCDDGMYCTECQCNIMYALQQLMM